MLRILSILVLPFAAVIALALYGPMDKAGIRLGETYQTKQLWRFNGGFGGVACRFREDYDGFLSARASEDMLRLFSLFESNRCYQVRSGIVVQVLELDTAILNKPIVQVRLDSEVDAYTLTATGLGANTPGEA